MAYVQKLNVERFERLLRSVTDPDNRAQIARLLAEERAKDDSAYPIKRRMLRDGRLSQ
jgi:hypothetical protein